MFTGTPGPPSAAGQHPVREKLAGEGEIAVRHLVPPVSLGGRLRRPAELAPRRVIAGQVADRAARAPTSNGGTRTSPSIQPQRGQVEVQDRLAVGHALQRGEAERLTPRRQHHEGAAVQQVLLALAGDVADPADLTAGSGEQRRELALLTPVPAPAISRGMVSPLLSYAASSRSSPFSQMSMRPRYRMCSPWPSSRSSSGGSVDAVRDDPHGGRRAVPADARLVGGVEHHDVAVEAQAEPLDQEEREPVPVPHLLAAQVLCESHDRCPREEREEAGGERRGEALDPQVVRDPPGRERQQRVEEQLPGRAARPSRPAGCR